MNGSEFSCHGKEMIEYIKNYLENIECRRVTPNIEPGYLRKLIPEEAPEHPEDWKDIIADVETKIMPGVTHWQHPRFHAYFPSGNSYPSIMAEILSAGIGCIGFSWVRYLFIELPKISSIKVVQKNFSKYIFSSHFQF